MRRILIATALLVPAASSGCAGTPPAAAPPPASEPPAPTAEVLSLRFPLEDYELSLTEAATVETAEDILVGRCMTARGLRWQALPRVTVTEIPNRRRYGVIEPAVAATFGYHLVEEPSDRKRSRDRRLRDLALTRDQRLAAYGTGGTGGCWAEANARAWRDMPAAEDALLRRLVQESFATSLRDPHLRSSFRAWSRCMAGRGFGYPDPLSAAADPRWRSPRPSREETRTAVADVACKEQAGLVRTWSAIETAFHRKAAERHRRALLVLRAAKAAWLADVRRIISEAP
ncbi:hypothetical protein [Microbispora sp. NPDC046933]|uniref:hypothetical protein n=1 Tax=Microbispora sp. NPDC046933 TaxID=3155618 RepID=UPI0033E0E503